MTTAPAMVPRDYPELAGLVWNGDPARPITPSEALFLYERNWRFVDRERPSEREAALIRRSPSRSATGICWCDPGGQALDAVASPVSI